MDEEALTVSRSDPREHLLLLEGLELQVQAGR